MQRYAVSRVSNRLSCLPMSISAIACFALVLSFALMSFGSCAAEDLLTPGERLWLTENQSRLLLGVETGYAPFVFLDAGGQATGLAQDYLDLLEVKLGVKFRRKLYTSLDAILQEVPRGKVQIVNAVTKTPTRSRILAFTDPYISVPNVIIVQKHHHGRITEQQLKGQRVSLVNNYAVTEYLTTKGIDFIPSFAPDDLTALFDVSSGHSDAAVLDLATATYLISHKGITNLRIAGETNFDIRLALAVPIAEHILHSILNKGLAAVTAAEGKAIHSRWIHSSRDSMFEDPRVRIIAGALLLGILTVIGIISSWNITLRRQVARHTKELQNEKNALIQSENSRHLAQEAAHAGTWEWNLKTNENTWSNQLWKLYGLDPAIDKPSYETWLESVHPDNRSDIAALVKNVASAGAELNAEWRVNLQSGEVRWLMSRGKPIRDDRGAVTRYSGIVIDITERKQIENTRQFLLQIASEISGEDFFAALARYLSVQLKMGFVCIDRLAGDGLYAHTLAVYHDGKFEDNVTYALKDTPCGDVVGKTICCFPRDVCTLFPRDPVLRELAAESYIGTTLWSHDGRPVGLIAVIGKERLESRQQAELLLNLVASRAASEIERRMADEVLRNSESKFRTIFEESPVAIWEEDFSGVKARLDELRRNGVTDLEIFLDQNPQEVLNLAAVVRIRDINQKSVELLSAENTEQVYRELPQYFTEDSLPVFKRELIALAAGKTRFQSEIPILNAKGEKLYLLLALAVQPGSEETLSRVIVSFLDITEIKRAETLLWNEKALLRSLIDAANDLIYFKDQNSVYLGCNKASENFLGIKEYEQIGKTDFDFFDDEKARAIVKHDQKVIEGGLSVRVEEWTPGPDGSKVLLDTIKTPIYGPDGYPIGLVGVSRDITERKKADEEKGRLEAQLRQSQKMESIGTLAGGIAHDFNNILTTIIGYGNITLTKMVKDDPLRSNIDHILEASDRAAHLTKDLLLFSRKQPVDKKNINLTEVIHKLSRFLLRVIGEDIDFKTTLYMGDVFILADEYQIGQVLMNLATNARDAMPRGGSFSVTTEKVHLDQEFISLHGFGTPGSYALIKASDTGYGMDEDTLQHIFEPFYTTKEVGKGTGLGLAVAYGIIKQHDGHILVSSSPETGTAFSIYLPIVASASVKPALLADKPLVGGSETILMAEDNESVRTLNKTVLNEYGYNIITAVDGEDAVDKFEANKDHIQLLLFDLIMPKKSGKEAYDEIRKSNPDIRIIFASGYSPDIVQDKAFLEKDVTIVFKPVTPFDLLRKVRSVLDG